MSLSARSRAVLTLVAVVLLGVLAFVLGHRGGPASGASTGPTTRATAPAHPAGRASDRAATRAVVEGAGTGLAPGSTDPASGLEVVALSSLPPQAADTFRLIRAGGPFPYPQDGVVYHNANRMLPRKADGRYHEYTVRTPGSKTRGARRIIQGDGNEFYWTSDHYDSFRRIA